MSDLKQIVEESFERYAANVILDRAICDVRDLIKPSIRKMLYSQLAVTKNLPNKPYVKCARVVGDVLGHFYDHGDKAAYAAYMRLGKSFAMRYPIEDTYGNTGTISESIDEADMRYTDIRLSPLGYALFDGINKNTITEWNPNFDETELYPRITCSKGFYNICNGSTGIGVGISSSIPQFNLRDINNAMITLINNPNAEISILPDFSTGAILINPNEVLESLKKGKGAACKLRSVIEYNAKGNYFHVKEIPYSVYTTTISKEIKDLVDAQPDCGIRDINDGSSDEVDYVIYLEKKANPDKVLKLLYKETSLQYHYTINMTVLTNGGRIPKVLSLREMLLEHIEHEKVIYKREFEFDLKKILDRIHIIDGLQKAYDAIDEVIKTIKGAENTQKANVALRTLLSIDEAQASAILELKLSKLSKLDINKLIAEKENLEKEKERIEKILSNTELFNNELIRGWKEVADKYSDARRTKIMNLTDGDDEVIEKKQLQISFTNKDALFAIESSTLYTQRRGGVGNKFKLDKDEYVTTSIIVDNTDELLFFTESGNVYRYKSNEIALNQKSYISNYITLSPNERVCALTSSNKSKKYIIFITKDGYLKKSELSEYGTKRNTGIKALNLSTGDHIVSALLCDDEPVGILTKNGNFLITDTSDVRALGRVAAGVHGIKLNDGDEVVSAHLIPNSTTEIVSISKNGLFKKTAYNEFSKQGKNTKGSKIQKLNENDRMADYIPISQKVDLIIGSSLSTIKLTSDDVPLQTKLTLGIKSMKLNEIGEVLKILICE